MYNVTIFFCDRTNVRSKLLLLGHLPNLVGHCPMSDSNLQPCIVMSRTDAQNGLDFHFKDLQFVMIDLELEQVKLQCASVCPTLLF